MKSLKTIFMLLLCNMLGLVVAHSQGLKTAVYFSSGQSKLDAKALVTLDSVLSLCAAYPDVALDIKAYADDRGEELANKKLSNRRAAEVYRFLKEKGLNPNKEVINGLGEVASVDGSNIDLERENNRRVDITITPFAPEKWEDYYSFYKHRNTQVYAVRNDRDTTIVGKKGTLLFIPKNSFVTADNQSLGKELVEVKIYEAYTYNDMLLQNLTTVSDGQLLETGGMVHIEAKLKSDGRDVRISPEEELRLTMPSSQPLPAGMQLFTAERSMSATDQAINWRTDGIKFSQPDLLKTMSVNLSDFTSMLESNYKMPEALELPIVDMNLMTQKLLEPSILPMPIQNFSKPALVPSFDDFKLTCPRREANKVLKKESKKEYKDRLNNLYNSLVKKYQADSVKFVLRKLDYDKMVANHINDSLTYDSRLATYEKNLQLHENACNTIRNWLKENKKELIDWHSNLTGVANGKLTIKQYFANIRRLFKTQAEMKQQAQLAKLYSLMDSIDKLTLNVHAVKKAAIKLHFAVKDIDVKLPLLQRYCKGDIKDLVGMLNSIEFLPPNELIGLCSFIQKTNESIPDLQELHQVFGQFSSDSSLVAVVSYLEELKKVNEVFEQENKVRRWAHFVAVWESKWYDVLTEAEQNAYDKFDLKEKEIFISDHVSKQAEIVRKAKVKALENEYLASFTKVEKEQYEALDLVQKERFLNAFIRDQFGRVENVVGITSLGWINCDRFPGLELTALTIPVDQEPSKSVKYYICFKSMRALMPMYHYGNSLTASVPKGAEVQIIGIQLEGGQVRLSSIEGKVENLNNKPLKAFKTVRMDEMAAIVR